MSIYRKNELGQLVKTAGNIVQRWNNRIFTTTYSLEDDKEYYTIDSTANKYISGLTSYTFFQLLIDTPNVSNEVYIRYNGLSLRVVQSNLLPIEPGVIFRLMTFYIFDIGSEVIYYDSKLELLSPEVKFLYENNPNTNVFTDSEKTKLQYLEGSKFVGQYLTLEALELANPSPAIGSYGYVDAGEGTNTKKYIWDSTDLEWVSGSNLSEELTPTQVKQLYETNDDTNVFTDSEKTKLGALQDYTEIITQDNASGVVSCNLGFGQDVTYLNILVELELVLPTTFGHGYYAGVNFKTGSDAMEIIITTDTIYPIKIMKYDQVLSDFELSANKTVNLSLYCDGINLYCYYVEV